ncbi:uncharacterized protein [Argopecten irradians]|uniref:uncharacterized protein n=1 Tax=Argopecten irradians TaxID=31199 RepID=UPI003710F762
MGWRNTTPICFLLLIQIAETTGSRCSEAAQTAGIPYIRMCKDGNVTSDRVILGTHGVADTGETTCSCIVNSTSIVIIYIEYYGEGLNPNTSSCGSEVVVPKSGSVEEDIRYQCNTSPVRTVHVRPVTITWNRRSSGDSKYCLNVTGVVMIPNTTFTITCTKPFNSIPSPTTIPSTRTTTIASGGITNEPITSDVETETTSPVSHSTSSTKTHGNVVIVKK